ncbi:hypothetical protein JCM5353_007446 [Sporobolomyces roseus]
MEKYSKWRDASTGVAPFLLPLSPATTDSPLALVVLPFAYLIATVRTLLVVLLLLAQTILVEGILSIFLWYPPLYSALSRACNASISRTILVILGILNVSVETVLLRKTGRSPPTVPFEPKKGDLIISNSSSYVDLLYLSFRHNVTFLQPLLDANQSISTFKRISLIRAVWTNGRFPISEKLVGKGETLEEAIKNARGPVVVFPEGTTSNNRALLKFASFSTSSSKLLPSSKIYILSFKYSPPTRFTPSLTHPIPSHSPFLGPLPHLFQSLSSPTIQSLGVRRLHASESPKKLEWKEVEEVLASSGRFKKLGGLGWNEKETFEVERETPLDKGTMARPSSTRPYDPPPVANNQSRSSRPSSRSSDPLPPPSPHQSLSEEVSQAFREVEGFAQHGEHALEEVEKFARTGREMSEVFGREYGVGKKENDGESTEVEDGSAEELDRLTDREEEEKRSKRPLLDKKPKKQNVVPYTSVSAPDFNSSKREVENKVDTIDSFRNDLDSTQEKVDDLFDLLEIIATERFQLTGATYNLRHLLVKSTSSSSIPSIDRSNSRRHLKRSKKLSRKVLLANSSLLSTYQEICELSIRYKLVGVKDKKLGREYTTLNSSFAKILDFVEDRAKEEREDVREGRMERRLLEEVKEDHPEWDESRKLKELKKVKEEVKRNQGFDRIDLESYTGKWLISNPFTELDRTALQQIDVEENKQRQTSGTSTMLTSEPKKEDVWGGIGNMISNVFTRTSPSSSRSPTPSFLELGRPKSKSRKSRKSTQSHSYHELSHHPSHELPSNSEVLDVEKQRRGVIPVRKTEREKELEDTEIPYQVPSDDTSGYVESKEELMQDQKDRLETEHFWTPFVIIEWVLIILMIFYWSIARGIGYDHPLGNLELGKIVGNDAWNDTKTYYHPATNSTITSTLESTTSSSSPSSTGQAVKLTFSSTATGEALSTGSILLSSSAQIRTALASASTSEPTTSMISHSTLSEQD